MAHPKRQRKTRTAAKDVEIKQRQQVAMELRKNGYSLRDIAQELGVSHELARRDIKAAMSLLAKETSLTANQYRAAQVARMEEIIRFHRPIALDPGHENCYQSIMAVTKAEQNLAKLMGTEMPTKVETKNRTTTSGGMKWDMEVISSNLGLASAVFTPRKEEEEKTEDE